MISRNPIVFVQVTPLGREGPPISAELYAAAYAEFKRNGERTLTAGKVRHLRRQLRRGKPPGRAYVS